MVQRHLSLTGTERLFSWCGSGARSSFRVIRQDWKHGITCWWMARKRERERVRDRAFSPGGRWALKNGNPIVSTAHHRSFTADTRKPTLNPKPGVPSFSLRLDPRPSYSSRSFYQFSPRIRWKGMRALRRIVKYFTLDPRGPRPLSLFSKKTSNAYFISRKHEEFNSIAHFRMPMRKPRTRIVYFWHHF